jgi:hypothetical protein
MFKRSQRGHGHNSKPIRPWAEAAYSCNAKTLRVPPIKSPNPSIPPAYHSCARKQASEFEAWRPVLHVAFACRSSSAADVPPLPNPSPPPRLVIRITAPLPLRTSQPPQLLPGSSGRARVPRRAGRSIDRREAATRDRVSRSSVFRFRNPPPCVMGLLGCACCRLVVVAQTLTTRVRRMLQAGGAAATAHTGPSGGDANLIALCRRQRRRGLPDPRRASGPGARPPLRRLRVGRDGYRRRRGGLRFGGGLRARWCPLAWTCVTGQHGGRRRRGRRARRATAARRLPQRFPPPRPPRHEAAPPRRGQPPACVRQPPRRGPLVA